MPFPKSAHDKSVLATSALTLEQISIVFDHAEKHRESFMSTGRFSPDTSVKSVAESKGGPRVVSCLFFEPSTRTRMSFEMAALRLGYKVQLMSSSSSTSLSKGESYADTVLNILAMKPDALVIRYGESPELDALLPQVKIPVLNAGSGVVSHPTQALLDALTIRQHVRNTSQSHSPAELVSPSKFLAGQKVLIAGDVRHSRVANSNFDVLLRLGAEVAICAPAEFLPEAANLPSGIAVIKDLDEATAWADIYMALRIQLERHGSGHGSGHSLSDYNSQFGLNPRRLQILKKNAIIMHPGPIHPGVELSIEAIQDPRARIMNQVENGVYIRAALLARALN